MHDQRSLDPPPARPSRPRGLAWSAVLLAALLGGGCAVAAQPPGLDDDGGASAEAGDAADAGPDGTEPGADAAPDDDPQILLFQLSPTSLPAGEPVLLQWSTRNALHLSLSSEREGDLGTLPAAGSRTIVPGGSELFTLEAVGRVGRVVVQRGVEVLPLPQTSLRVDRSLVAIGETVRISWSARDATSLSLLANGVALLPQPAPLAGMLPWAVPGDTLLRLEAEGPGGRTVLERQVTVLPLPRITHFGANPPQVAAGASTRLDWTTADADRVELSCGGERVTRETLPAAGSWSQAIAASTVCRLAASGPGGQVTQELTVEVLPSPAIVRFVADPPHCRAGEATTLRWETTDAAEVVISEQALETNPQTFAPAGELVIHPVVTTSYRLEARGPGGSTEATVEVIVPPRPVVTLLTVSPVQVAAGGSVQLRWATEAAESVQLFAGGLPLSFAEALPPAAGSVSLVVEAATRFDLLALGPGGESWAGVDVALIPRPRIERFVAAPLRLPVGGQTVLRWSVQGATTLELTADGLPLGNAAPAAVGERSVVVQRTTQFGLRAVNLGGAVTATQAVTAVPPPRIVEFELEPAVVQAGELTRVRWNVLDAEEIVLRDDVGAGTVLYRGTDAVHELSLRVQRSMQLQLTAGGEFTERLASRSVVAGPPGPVRIRRFTVEPTFALVGEPVTLDWEVDGAWQIQLFDPDGTLLTTQRDAAALGGSWTLAQAARAGNYRLLALGVDGQADAEVRLELGPGHPLLATVYYNPPGADRDQEWVELFNPTALPLELAGWSLGSGGADWGDTHCALSGTIPPGECYGVGGPAALASGTWLSHDFVPDLQNGGAVADGVALFELPGGTTTATSRPREVVLYGESNSSLLIGPEGLPAPIDLPAAGEGQAAVRLSYLPAVWQNQPVPAPGGCFPPALHEVLPVEGPVSGGVELRVTVDGLRPPFSVRLGDVELDCRRTGWAELRCLAPPLAAGRWTLSLQNRDGSGALLPDAYLARP